MAFSEKSFLGTGWSFPPAFLRASSSVAMVSDDDDIHQALRVLFSTNLGERVMLPDYGTDLWRRVFGNMSTTLRTEIAAGVRRAIVMWEPRIEVLDVDVQADPGIGGPVTIIVDYVIRSTNTRSNFVYPFYLQEATLAPAPL